MRDDVIDRIGVLHAAIDEAARRLASRHAGRLRCGRGCASCCVDGLTVFTVEAERIRRAYPELLASGAPSAAGCAMLDADGACRVYDARPYVCRTQGLPLRWVEGRIERRDICPLNEEGRPLPEIAADDCWTLGPVEEALARLQQLVDGGRGERVALRDLFATRGNRAGAPGSVDAEEGP